MTFQKGFSISNTMFIERKKVPTNHEVSKGRFISNTMFIERKKVPTNHEVSKGCLFQTQCSSKEKRYQQIMKFQKGVLFQTQCSSKEKGYQQIMKIESLMTKGTVFSSICSSKKLTNQQINHEVVIWWCFVSQKFAAKRVCCFVGSCRRKLHHSRRFSRTRIGWFKLFVNDAALMALWLCGAWFHN